MWRPLMRIYALDADVLDRITGELLSAEAYAKVTWPSHVDIKTGRLAGHMATEATRMGA